MRRRACGRLWQQSTQKIRPSSHHHAALTSITTNTTAYSTTKHTQRGRLPLSSSSQSQVQEGEGARRVCYVYNVTGGAIPYDQAWFWQQRLLQERAAWQKETPSRREGHDVLLLLEHPSVYTLGRGSTLDNLRFDPADPESPHEVRRTERGGEVTWHGPGQIVGYPVLDLNFHKKDLHWYLRQLEEVCLCVSCW